jgi:hypothetical protein
LDEGAGELLLFPRRGRLAGAQANDHVLPAHRLAGMERDRLRNPIALVEDAEDGDALRHRRHRLLHGGLLAWGRLRPGSVLLFAPLAAGNERERDQQRCGKPVHAYSGIQGS